MFEQKTFQVSCVSAREGIQALHPIHPDRGVVFGPDQVYFLAENAAAVGADIFELGSPVRSPTKGKVMRETVRRVGNLIKVAAHCRCVREDIQSALECGVRRIHLFIGTSDELRNGNGKLSEEQIVQKAQQSIDYIQNSQSDSDPVIIRFSAEDATSTPVPRLRRVFEAVAPFVQVIGLPNTSGQGEVRDMVDTALQLSQVLPSHLAFQFHSHNDRGSAAYGYYEVYKVLNERGRPVIFDYSTLQLVNNI